MTIRRRVDNSHLQKKKPSVENEGEKQRAYVHVPVQPPIQVQPSREPSKRKAIKQPDLMFAYEKTSKAKKRVAKMQVPQSSKGSSESPLAKKALAARKKNKFRLNWTSKQALEWETAKESDEVPRATDRIIDEEPVDKHHAADGDDEASNEDEEEDAQRGRHEEEYEEQDHGDSESEEEKDAQRGRQEEEYEEQDHGDSESEEEEDAQRGQEEEEYEEEEEDAQGGREVGRYEEDHGDSESEESEESDGENDSSTGEEVLPDKKRKVRGEAKMKENLPFSERPKLYVVDERAFKSSPFDPKVVSTIAQLVKRNVDGPYSTYGEFPVELQKECLRAFLMKYRWGKHEDEKHCCDAFHRIAGCRYSNMLTKLRGDVEKKAKSSAPSSWK